MPSKKSDRRQMNPISLAFLDVMFCGFGAVILIFLILDHTSTVADVLSNPELTAEINLLREETEEGQLGLVQLRNTLSDVDFEVVTANGMARQIQQQLDTFLQELAALENSSPATEESIEKLRADVRALEEELLRLQARALRQDGNSVRSHQGDGDRQYLSGLYLGGQRILVLVDSSASMLDRSIANILRTRNMSDERQRQSPKWQKVIKTVDWLSSQLPRNAEYQIFNFNIDYGALVSGTEGKWLEVADTDQLNQAIESMKAILPAEGTNMQQIFKVAAAMRPPPDNIFLITDGLPTQGDAGPRAKTVTEREREKLFEDAIKALPPRVPVNVILLPLEADRRAAGHFWELAQNTEGAFLIPTSDWP